MTFRFQARAKPQSISLQGLALKPNTDDMRGVMVGVAGLSIIDPAAAALQGSAHLMYR